MNTVTYDSNDQDVLNELGFDALPTLIRAHEAIVRLDERVSRSPVGRAWSERVFFRQACDAQYAQGHLVTVEELVLLGGGARDQPGYPDLMDTLDMLRLWRQALDQDASDLLRAMRPGISNSNLPDPYPTLRRAVRLRGVLKEPPLDPTSVIDPARLEKWRRVLRSSERLPPVLAAAVVWDCWIRLVPEAASAWRGTLLAALLLKSRGTTTNLLLPIDCGWRVSPYRVKASDPRGARLLGFVSWLEAAASEGRKELTKLTLADIQLRRHLRGRRSHSRLPALARLFLSVPLVTIPLAARHIGCSTQAVEKMLPMLGSLPREVTERSRFRAWTVP
jgi:hypothetical protein